MASRSARASSSPLDGVDLLLFDLDGVIYAGPSAIPFAIDAVNLAHESIAVGYITNNASRTDAQVAEHLSELGLRVDATDVVTSPQAAVRLLADLVPAGSTILVVGGDGLVDEVQKGGFAVTRSAEDDPAAVVQGFAPHVGWTQLAEAAFALQGEHAERPWVATNTDWTIPQGRGTAPGNGTLVSAVHTAIGRLPLVAGKPETAMFTLALERFGASKALVVGDRLDTDILGAVRSGIDSALVLTGIDKAKQVLAADSTMRPTYILSDLRELHEPYPPVVEKERRGGTEYAVGSARVRRSGENIDIVAGSGIDLLRAGCAAVWRSGVPIYGLRVPAELYS